MAKMITISISGFILIQLIMGQKHIMPIEQNIISWTALSWEDGMS